jgi:hypothetical protein
MEEKRRGGRIKNKFHGSFWKGPTHYPMAKTFAPTYAMEDNGVVEYIE